ncbi:MAG TPA: class I SAM-dependent methyltransferase [Deltaproteobacteria bacterium]|nr:class I SAM-dependent methyltransferase [Deltaproteobacteria bacterium]
MNENIQAGFQFMTGALRYAIETGDEDKTLEFIRLFGDILAFYRKYWRIDVDSYYEAALQLFEKPEQHLLLAAMDAFSRNLAQDSVKLAGKAADLAPTVRYKMEHVFLLIRAGRIVQARQIISGLVHQYPDNLSVANELFTCEVAERFWHRDYYDLLAEVHERYTPGVYLEIGVATGKSLALTRRSTRALGIDPASAATELLVYHSPESDPQLYKMTSDDFFASLDLKTEMGRDHFDVAFIDGLHHFDQVLRDFINMEQFAGPDSIILIHDSLPVDPRVATRERNTVFWTGDVWKIIPCLRAVRPDLEIITLPLPPAGLALVRRLNPGSRLLSRQYINVVDQFDTLELPDSWEKRCNLLAVEMEESRFTIADYVPKGGWS